MTLICSTGGAEILSIIIMNFCLLSLLLTFKTISQILMKFSGIFPCGRVTQDCSQDSIAVDPWFLMKFSIPALVDSLRTWWGCTSDLCLICVFMWSCSWFYFVYFLGKILNKRIMMILCSTDRHLLFLIKWPKIIPTINGAWPFRQNMKIWDEQQRHLVHNFVCPFYKEHFAQVSAQYQRWLLRRSQK